MTRGGERGAWIRRCRNAIGNGSLDETVSAAENDDMGDRRPPGSQPRRGHTRGPGRAEPIFQAVPARRRAQPPSAVRPVSKLEKELASSRHPGKRPPRPRNGPVRRWSARAGECQRKAGSVRGAGFLVMPGTWPCIAGLYRPNGRTGKHMRRKTTLMSVPMVSSCRSLSLVALTDGFLVGPAPDPRSA